MNKILIFFLVVMVFSLATLSGCIGEPNISSPPTTARMVIQKTTCLDTPGDWNNYLNGDYNNLYLYVDFNRLCFRSVPDFNISGADINWSQLINFPSGCGANQAVKIVGSSLVCVDVVIPNDLNIYVPYQGAMSDVNLGLHNLLTNEVTVNKIITDSLEPAWNFISGVGISTGLGKDYLMDIAGGLTLNVDRDYTENPFSLVYQDAEIIHVDAINTIISGNNLALSPYNKVISFNGDIVTDINNIGVNNVVNSTFDSSGMWSFGTGWSYDSINDEADHATNGTGYLQQNITTEYGARYIIHFTIKNYTTGNVYASLAGANSPSYSGNGVYGYVLQSGGGTYLRFVPSSTGRFSIDNVYLEKVSSYNGERINLSNGYQNLLMGDNVTSGDSDFGITFTNDLFPGRNISQNIYAQQNLMNFGVNSPNTGGSDYTNPTGVQFQLDARGLYGIFKIYQQIWCGEDCWSEYNPFSVMDNGAVKVGYSSGIDAIFNVQGGNGDDAPNQSDLDIVHANLWDGTQAFNLNNLGNAIFGFDLNVLGVSKFGGFSNYSSFDSNGVLALSGSAKVRKSLQITSNSAKGSGSAVYTTLGLDGALIYEDGKSDTASAVVALPSDMDRSGLPKLRLGWANSATSGDVNWQFDYVYKSLDEDTSSVVPDGTVTVVTGVSSTAYGYKYSEVTLVAPSASDRILQFRVTRLGTASSDTAGGSCYAFGVLFDYVSDKLGS